MDAITPKLAEALRAIYKTLPETATPAEFMKGHGNWGLTEKEYAIAKIAATALTEYEASHA